MMPNDLKELLRAFNDHEVKYLIVGGYAFGVHAEPRATKDLDIFIRADEENSKAVFRALAQYGAPLTDLNPSDFMDGTTFSALHRIVTKALVIIADAECFWPDHKRGWPLIPLEPLNIMCVYAPQTTF